MKSVWHSTEIRVKSTNGLPAELELTLIAVTEIGGLFFTSWHG